MSNIVAKAVQALLRVNDEDVSVWTDGKRHNSI
jgi:hypothetical protein